MMKLIFPLIVTAFLIGCSGSKEAAVKEAKTAIAENADLSKYSLDAKSAVKDVSGVSDVSPDIVKKYGIVEKDGKKFIPAMIKVGGDFKESDLSAKGAEVQSTSGNIVNALCPYDTFHELSKINGVEMIDIAPKSNPK